MKTDDLIAHLAEANALAPKHALLRVLARGIGTGAAVAFVFTIAVLGWRHDFRQAVGDWHYWAKFAYPLTLAVVAAVLVERLARPGVSAGRLWLAAAIPPAAAAVLALLQWQGTPAGDHAVLLYGRSWLVCPFLIVLVSVPVAVGLTWSLKRLAPTRAIEAGAAAGLLSGAAGAWIYAFHCNETSLVFVALWYTAGIALTAALGALGGPRLLRW